LPFFKSGVKVIFVKNHASMFNYKVVIALSIVCFSLVKSFAQTKLSKEQALEDIHYLRQKVQNFHPGAYYYSNRNDFESKIDAISNSIIDSLNSLELYRKIMPIIANIKDSHTNIRPFLPKKKRPKVLPLFLRQFNNQFYIHFNASNDSTILRTSILKSVNKVPITELYNLLGQQVGVDNGNEISKNYYLTNNFNAYFYRYFGQIDSLTIEYLLPNSDKVLTKKIAALSGSEMDKNLSKRYKVKAPKNFDYTIIDTTNKAAILIINAFKAKKNFLDILQFQYSIKIKRAFKQLAKDSIENLAIDFRGNGGGFIPNVHRTLKYIINEPVSVISKTKINPKTRWKLFPVWMVAPPILGFLKYRKKENGMLLHKNIFLNTVRPSKHNFRGKLYFITDGGSYSATCMTLAIARDHNIGKIIGTRPGGANWGSFAGTWINITLPNSKITSHIPLQKIENYLPNNVNKGFFMEPDIKIEPSFEMFLALKDTAKEALKEIVKPVKNPTK
jgi:hypothetical protein